MISFSKDELDRYSKQLCLDEIGSLGQEKLKNSSVLCVGLGGLGAPLLLYLASAGVGRIGLVDDDVVELSNLQRQILYRTKDIGSRKADAAREQLLALNPLIEVISYSKRLTAESAFELIANYDLIADGSDNFSTRYLIHDLCFKLAKPYFYASASQYTGLCSVFYKSPCLRCLFPSPPKFLPSCNSEGVLGVLPGILGLIQATEIIKWILNLGESLEKRLLMVDLLKLSFKEIRLWQNPECELC